MRKLCLASSNILQEAGASDWYSQAELGNEVKEYYKKITRRSGKHVARTVVGKELAKIVWHMLSKDQKYKGFKGRMTRVTKQTYWPQPISPNA